MSRDTLVSIARRNLAHQAAGRQGRTDGVMEIPVSRYIDPERWQLERDRVFRRLPLVVGASCELREPHSYLSGETAGTPYLVTRGDDGELRAFVNMCSHRGAIITPEGSGTARRHTCPYHAWSYDTSGELVGVFDGDDFGDIDRSCHGLTPLQCAERAGLVWIFLDREPDIDIDTFLCGYDDMLGHLGLADCHPVGRQQIAGPNWKLAYDGYLDLYHLPILHRDTFGPQMSSKAVYDAWGPHQRVTSPDGHGRLADLAEDDWPLDELIGGVWTVFPHVSIAAFDKGRLIMVSILSLGDEPGSSTTTQLFLHRDEPDDELQEHVDKIMAFNHHVVANEDYFTGLRVQRALHSGGKEVALFGRNEGGGQRFHTFLEELLAVDDHDLAAFFDKQSVELDSGIS